MAPNIKFKLTESQLQRFCDLFGLDPTTVEAINNISCLNTEFIRDLLIKEDFEQYTQGIKMLQTIQKSYTFDEITRAIAKAYNTTPADVHNVVTNKKNTNLLFCKRCGKRINARVNTRTGGLCKECMVDSLGL